MDLSVIWGFTSVLLWAPDAEAVRSDIEEKLKDEFLRELYEP